MSTVRNSTAGPEKASALCVRSVSVLWQVIAQVRSVPIFRDLLDVETQSVVAERCKILRFEEGECIVRQGAPGHSMLVIRHGLVSIWKDGRERVEIAQLGPPQTFCEMNLLVPTAPPPGPRDPRPAALRSCGAELLTAPPTAPARQDPLVVCDGAHAARARRSAPVPPPPRTRVRAQPGAASKRRSSTRSCSLGEGHLPSGGHLLRPQIPREALLPVFLVEPQLALYMAQAVTDRQQAPGGGKAQRQLETLALSSDIDAHFSPKQLLALLRAVPILQPLTGDDGMLAAMAARASVASFRPGEVVVTQGDTADQALYVMASGVAEVVGTLREDEPGAASLMSSDHRFSKLAVHGLHAAIADLWTARLQRKGLHC